MMRMRCPYCGLGGTADEHCYNKIVRCPECRGMFRVTEEIALDPVRQRGEPINPGNTSSARNTGQDQEGQAGITETRTETMSDDTGFGQCGICGFTFSSKFLRLVDTQQVCPICVGQNER